MPSMIKTMPSSTQGQHNFATVPRADIPRSQFNRPSNLKTTFDAGYLVPCFLDEVLPGDTFNVRMSAFARLATPIKPLMDNIWLDVHFFFVPMRLLWENWEKFQGSQDNPADSVAFTIPLISSHTPAIGSLSDYLGLPSEIASGTVNTLPFRAYALIWNQWYRDQNLQNSIAVSLGNGPDVIATYPLQRRGKRHDYFTSALPWTQKGTAVTIPLGTTAPVIPHPSGAAPFFASGAANAGVMEAITATDPSALQINWGAGAPAAGGDITWDPAGPTGLQTDLTNASAATINSLRQAFQIQKIYERDARSGTRYVEALKARWGVTSPDARLQRPEYLGGGTTPIIISPIAQTSSTDATTPQANLSAVGTASLHGIGFAKSFPEHGYILGLMSARADLNYSQGMDRLWTRATRFDFAEPALTHIGEQAILNREIFYQASPTPDNAVFGYQERHAEYRYKPSIATGLMRPSATGTIGNIWTLIQDFSVLPTLSSTFIQENPDIDRVIAVPTEPHFILDAHFDTKCARALPMFGVPGLIDHF